MSATVMLETAIADGSCGDLVAAPNNDSSDEDDQAPTGDTNVASAAAPKKTKRRGGRPAGSRNWSESETDLLLDAVEEVLPTGSKKWDKVALLLYEAKKQGTTKQRDGVACKRRFYALANVEKPTGSSQVPRLVARAKDIKEKIDAHEVIGQVAKNNSTSSSSSISSGCDIQDDNAAPLKGTSLLGEDNKIRRPATKKWKATVLQESTANAMQGLIESQNKAAETMASAMRAMGREMGQQFAAMNGRSDKEMKTRIDAMDQKLSLLLEKLDK